MPPYVGPERRYNPDFERDMYTFMGEVKQALKDQPGRCANHSDRINELDARSTDIEQAIGFRKGDENTIHARVQVVESFRSSVVFALQAILWLSGASGVLYGAFVVLLHFSKEFSK